MDNYYTSLIIYILCIITDQIEQYRRKTQMILQSSEKVTRSSSNFKYIKPKIQSDLKNLVCDSSLNSKTLPGSSTKNVHVKSKLLTTNVHVNPNFKRQNPTVHINPNVHAKPLIHINPKMMHDISNSNQNLQSNISTTNTSMVKTNVNNNTEQANVKRSIYVNPTLLKKLSSSKEKSTNSKELIPTERPVCSRLRLVKNIDNRKISNSPKKTSNSSIVLLSRRKLVRVSTTKNTSRTSPLCQRRPSKYAELKDKKLEIQKAMKMKSLINNTSQSTSISNLSKSNINKSNNKSKVTKYKIDRTACIKHVSKAKEIGLLEMTKV